MESLCVIGRPFTAAVAVGRPVPFFCGIEDMCCDMSSCGGLSEPSGPSPSACAVSEESGTVLMEDMLCIELGMLKVVVREEGIGQWSCCVVSIGKS
jgi:hypothetical protein